MTKKTTRLPAKRSASASSAQVPAIIEPKSELRTIGDALVRLDQVYYMERLAPVGDGPWKGEAHKLAWVDPDTGLHCVVLRSPSGGFLSGFVGVGPDHPLFGYSHDAIPASLGIQAHGGLNYSATCAVEGPEYLKVCHTMVAVPPSGRPAAGEHDPHWWLGFSCNQTCDLIPGRYTKPDPALGDEPVYRDERYLLDQCTSLARQLDAIGRGKSASSVPAAPIPPIGLDPSKAS